MDNDVRVIDLMTPERLAVEVLETKSQLVVIAKQLDRLTTSVTRIIELLEKQSVINTQHDQAIRALEGRPS